MTIKKKLYSELKKIWNKNNKKETFVPGKSTIPVSGKVIDFEEIEFMIEASMDGWLTTGRFNKLFEKKIAEETGSKIAFTVNSGSSANLIAFSTLTSPQLKERQIKPGDEVITAAASFPTTVNPIIQNRAIPVFIDLDIPTYNILPEAVEKAITKKTKAIMVAHTLGNPYNVKKIKEICEKNNLWLIQDTCDALGAEYDKKKLGYYGDIGTLSFYPAHHITMGEGGAVFFNNIRLKKIAESFRDWGRDCYCETGMDNTCGKRFNWQLGSLPEGYDHKYTYSHMGYNLKITDMQAACGLAQTKKLNFFIKKRRTNFEYLNNLMKNLEEYFILPKETPKSKASWFGYLLTIRDNQSFTRNQLVQYLNDHKIGTRLLFSGNIIKQPFMKNVSYIINEDLKNTDKIMSDTFWVGVYPGLENQHLNYIYETINDFVRKVA